VAHDGSGLAIPSRLIAETLVIPARLRNQALAAFDYGRPTGRNGDLAIGGEQVGVLLRRAGAASNSRTAKILEMGISI